MAAAVSRAGALGGLAVGAMTAAAADAAIAAALSAGSGPLNVNVFVHAPPRRAPDREAAWLARLAPLFAEFGAAAPAALDEPYPTFSASPGLLDVLLARRPALVSCHFGVPEPTAVQALQARGILLAGTATTVAEAQRLQAAGIDVIVAQGWEAGGHRGCFDGSSAPGLRTLDLLQRVLAAVDLPVLAAGGITSAADISAALALGAAGVQLGSAFLDCPESAASAEHGQALRAPDRATVMTRVFSGRPARGIRNRFTDSMHRQQDDAPDYPVTYAAGKQLAAVARARGSADFDAMWAGTGRLHYPPMPAGELVATLARDLAHGGSPPD
jgi:nitronate monooxygenase